MYTQSAEKMRSLPLGLSGKDGSRRPIKKPFAVVHAQMMAYTRAVRSMGLLMGLWVKRGGSNRTWFWLE